MKGHFLPRKSKLVFLNNSIEPVTAGLEFQTPARHQKFPPKPQNDPGYHKPGRSNYSNTKRYCPPLTAQFPIEDSSRNKHRGEDIREQSDNQRDGKSFDRTGPEEEQETA
jgi:hypothetical protein